jgi:hypothetical protein
VTPSDSNIVSLRPAHPLQEGPTAAHESVTLSGSLSVVSPLDLLEWLCSNKKVWSIRLHGQGLDAEVTVVGGQILDARWGDIHGMDALCEIVGCQQGFFELVPVTATPEPTLHGHWQSLLLGAVQMLDERKHHKGAHTMSEGISERRLLSLRGGAISAEALVDQGFAALRTGDAAEAKRLWTEALVLDPDNRAVRFNLRKLDSNA